MFSLKRSVASMAFVIGALFSFASEDAKSQVVVSYDDALTAASPTFQRPQEGAPPTTKANAATYKYHVRQFSVPASGTYSVRSSAAFDQFTALYFNAFTSSQPLQNIIVANDDVAGTLRSGFDAALTAGVNYFLVTTTFSSASSVMGTFTNAVFQPEAPPSSVFQRPSIGYPPTTTETAATYPYYTESWTPTVTGFYKIKSLAAAPSLFDTFTVLYNSSGFIPASPLNNVIVANATFVDEGYSSGFYFSATAGQTYTIVTTGESTEDFGNFTTEKTLVAPLRNSFVNTTVGAPPFTGGRPNDSIPANTPPVGRSDSTPPYKAYTMMVGVSGNYTFHMIHPDPISTQFDTFLVIFGGALNLENTSNALVANDDFLTYTARNRSAILNFPLVTGQIYTIVVTGFTKDSAGDFLLEAFGPGTVSIVRPVSISGQITTQSPNKPLPIRFAVRPVGGTVADDVMRTVTVTTNAQGKGNYQINDIPAGLVNLAAKGELTLQTLVSNIDASNDVAGVNFTLRGGDGNQDGFVDIGDLLRLIASYNKTFDPSNSGSGYSAQVDFNYDLSNNISDLLILISHYNQASQFLP